MRTPNACHDGQAIEQKMCITTLCMRQRKFRATYANSCVRANADGRACTEDASPCFSDGEPSNPYRSGNRNNITERNTGKGWE